MSEPSSQSSSQSSAASVFVGRERELGELRASLDESLAGRGRLAMLVGEPGIGKTRTAQELTSYAQSRGSQVYWGRCYEESGAPPYWPWVQAIRDYVQQSTPDRLQTEMGPGAADIAGIVPDINAKLPDLPTPPALEPEQARFRLFDSITRFFKTAGRSQPLVLVLDDLHWADEPSLLLLRFMSQQLQDSCILVVGCYRDVELSRQHPLSGTLAQLSREQGFQRHLLRGMSREETGQLVEAASGIQPRAPVVDTVHAHTDGNPYFMTELVRLLVSQGELDESGAMGSQGLRIPEGVREVIGQRLNRLSETCNRVLTTASVIGRDFGLDQLVRLHPELSEDQLLEVLEEALEARLIEEMPQAAGRNQFAHRLAQETLTQELSFIRRVRLHARIAAALEELYGTNAEAHAAELAYHFAQAETVIGVEKLMHYALIAGEQALAGYAYHEAQSCFQRGLAAKGTPLEGTDPARDSQEAALLAGLGRTQVAVLPRYQLQDAVATLGRAADYYIRNGNVAAAAAVVDCPIPDMGLRTGMTQLIARVLPLIPSGSASAGRTLCNYGRVLGLEADYQGAQEAFRKAGDIARTVADTTLEARILVSAFEVDIFNLKFQHAVQKGQRAIDLAHGTGERFAEVRALMWTCRAKILAGDLEGARERLSTLLRLGEELRDGHSLFQALFFNQQAHQVVGDWDTARDFHRRLIELSAQDMRHLCRRALIEYETGNLVEGQQYLESILQVMPENVPGPNSGYALPALTIPTIAYISGETVHLDLAESAAETVVSAPEVTPWIDSLARSGLGLLAVIREDQAAAAEQYEALQQRRGTLVAEGFLSIDRLSGLLSQTMGNPDQAAAHFEDALIFCRKAGYRPELAWSCCDYADTLLRRNESGDGTKAKALLDESLTISTDLGMRPLMERVTDRLDRIQAQPTPAPSYPAGLSQREVEVLRLIASGKTDREIAEELFISFRTVGNHVRNILNKTNSTNRTEAATYAAHQGLT